MQDDKLAIFSPLPPEQNGIADYTFHLLRPLTSLFRCAAFVADPQATAPPGVAIRDSLQAFRYLSPGSKILHQIGNNPGHVFVLEALRAWGGVTTLHDQNLHYLYETAGTSKAAMLRGMTASSQALGAAYARHWHESGVKTQANYVLFDMLDEVLARSSAVIVHSAFAKRRLDLLYGADRCQHVAVIPHLALPFGEFNAEEAATRLNLPAGKPLILTSGFATAAKRFDWLVAALDEICARGEDFYWVHAGKERPEEFALSALLQRHPQVRQRCRITGYLSEDDLNTYIGACDILVNLRFPSVGESSGTLARAMSAGKCCVVSNTAAYAELPDGAVAHVSISDALPDLVARLQSLLTDANLRSEIGAAARRLVESEWAPDVVAASYKAVIDQSFKGAPKAAPRPTVPDAPIRISLTPETTQAEIMLALALYGGAVDVVFEIESIEALASLSLDRPKMLTKLLPPGFTITSVRLERALPTTSETDPAPVGMAGPVLVRVNGTLP